MRGLVLVIAAALIACGDDHAAATDAGPTDATDGSTMSESCWPDTLVVGQGTLNLGTGYGGFEEMPAVLPLEYGPQGGYNLVAQVRMTGFSPGNPHDILDPTNPRTRIRAFFVEGNVPLNHYSNCPFRLWYVPSAGGGYELVHGVGVVFETCWHSPQLFGKQIRIEAEIRDNSGGYARAETIVTAAPPTGYYPNEPDAAGCEHPPPRYGLEDF